MNGDETLKKQESPEFIRGERQYVAITCVIVSSVSWLSGIVFTILLMQPLGAVCMGVGIVSTFAFSCIYNLDYRNYLRTIRLSKRNEKTK
jgi:hypothetical protein